MLKYFVAVILCCYWDVSCQQADPPVNPTCLGCICESISGCNTTAYCPGDVCGPLRLTWAYWVDSGKPTVNQQSPEEQSAFNNCASDLFCAAVSVQGYMQKYQQDCNGDGKINCDDFIAIHMLGGDGCNAPLPENYSQRYAHCKKLVGLN